MKVKIGSRKSALALWQTYHIATLLKAAHPGLAVEVITMDTLGDLRRDVPMPSLGAKGLFTRELEDALLSDTIDLAVHSLKDLPSALPEGLAYGGSPKRAAPTDAFISLKWNSLHELPEGATVATGSQRRRAQLLHHRPDLHLVDLRGNIDTRLQKLEDMGFDAIIMATAALHRLDLPDRITEELDPERYVPAVSQGAMGIEIRAGRQDVIDLLAPIQHAPTVQAVSAERAFMAHLEGGCSVALGAYCSHEGDHWRFRGFVSSSDGHQVLLESRQGNDPLALANTLAQRFIGRGARDILRR